MVLKLGFWWNSRFVLFAASTMFFFLWFFWSIPEGMADRLQNHSKHGRPAIITVFRGLYFNSICALVRKPPFGHVIFRMNKCDNNRPPKNCIYLHHPKKNHRRKQSIHLNAFGFDPLSPQPSIEFYSNIWVGPKKNPTRDACLTILFCSFASFVF